MEIDDKYLEGFDDQTKQKFRDCKSVSDIVAAAEADGIELTDDQMEMVTGGSAWATTYTVYHLDHEFKTTTYNPPTCDVCGAKLNW